ncbi:MAG: ribbon-helix-helix domain-containing protein [Methylovulum sp.]|nr:ribbon-helix-helix domain-containing protein [Methylovulum sp.]TSA39982.1 MAG: ribbon-helix-helix domain-containing protein [Methylococcaceae bacterium]
MNIENYKSVRIKSDTYKKLKLLSVETEIPITKLIDLMLIDYLKSTTHLTSPT